MKRIYEEYLYVPEDGKIREKVFVMRIAVAIVCVVCCLSAMGFSAYAFFASSITSGSNTIVAATYSVEVDVVPNGGTALVAKEDNPLIYENVGAGTYAMSLKAMGNATTGYCKIEIVGSEKTVTLFTQQMSPEMGMSFELAINGEANITITPQWGTYSNRDEVVSDKSTQEVQLVEAGKNVTTPSTPGVSHTSGIDEKPTADSKTEQSTGEAGTEGSTSTSGEGTENSDSLQDSETSQDGETSEGKSSDNVTDNSNADNGNSEDTIPGEKVSE